MEEIKHHIKGEREYKFLNELEMRTTRCLGETPWEDGGRHADVSGERREVGPTFTKLGQIRPSDDLCGKGWACPVVFFLFSVLRVLSRNPLWMNEASRRQICWRVEGATRSMQQANLSGIWKKGISYQELGAYIVAWKVGGGGIWAIPQKPSTGIRMLLGPNSIYEAGE